MELDDAYANGPYIPGAEGYPPRWAAAAEAFREALGERAQIGLSYGSAERAKLNLFLPEQTPKGLFVFVHGGYWRAFDASSWSHLAAGAMRHGWAVAMPSYTLCPEARISDITRQVAKAIEFAAGKIAGPISLAGHSAGGHLVSRMLAPDQLESSVAARLSHVVPISPLSDLRPLLQTSMNDDFRMGDAEAEAESPIFQPKPDVPVSVWVGAKERPAFLDQARWLAETWEAGHVVVPGQHHFDVIDPLADPESEMIKTLVG